MSTNHRGRNKGLHRDGIQGPWRYVVAAAPTVIFLMLVALVYFVLL